WMVVLNEAGDAAGQISMMPDTEPLLSLIDEAADRLMEEAESVILEIDLGEEIAERVIAAAERHGVPVYAIVGNLSVIERRPDLLFRTECIICNAVEFGKLFSADLRKNSPEEMVSFLQGIRHTDLPSVIVTLGARGSVTYDRRTGVYGIVPAEEVRVVDTSGAGDAFLSGVVMGRNHRITLTESAAIGTHLAALAIGTKNSAVPKNDDVHHLLRCFIREPAGIV
ncbi:MAG TPA: carbohydrate kinase family protein, partial [Clostridiales bacterium]|nr:carbohydrate kinase family protein [Clostridiales bacterium]